MNKSILCFHVGYIPDINDENTKNTYGSEIALVNISERFSKIYNVFIFGDAIYNEIVVNNVTYLNSNKFENFQDNNEIEITILLRYIYPLLDFEIKSKKLYLWVQDIYPMIFYQNLSIYNKGKSLLKNLIDKIDGVIALTNWHRNFLINFYEIEENKVIVIGNGIDITKFKNDIKKQKNKFIWTSHGYRGIENLIDHFHEIKRRIPDAELYIYRDRTAFSDDIYDEMLKYDYIHYGGKLTNDELIKEFQSSDIWYYPTHFEETYCISALEAQMSKCVCVTTDLAALSETVGNRGILIKDTINTIKYKNNAVDQIINILNNENLKKEYQELGHNWAIKQTWENRINEWYELFDKNNKII